MVKPGCSNVTVVTQNIKAVQKLRKITFLCWFSGLSRLFHSV